MFLAFGFVFFVQLFVLLFQLIVFLFLHCNLFLGLFCLFSGSLNLRLEPSDLFVLFHDFLGKRLKLVFEIEDFQVFDENHVKELFGHFNWICIPLLQLALVID